MKADVTPLCRMLLIEQSKDDNAASNNSVVVQHVTYSCMLVPQDLQAVNHSGITPACTQSYSGGLR